MKTKLNPAFTYIPIVLIIFLSSCNRNDRKIFRLVPDNTAVVCTFSPGKLLEKSGAKDLQFIKKALDGEEFSKLLFENPALSGINVNSNSCVFMFGTDQKFVGLVMPVKNKNVFEVFLDKLGKEFNDEFIKEAGENYTFSKKNGRIIAWNKSVLIYLGQINGCDIRSVETKLAELFKLGDENCILSEKDFKSFLSEQKDLNLWLTSNQIGSLTDTKMGMLSMLGAINNNYAHFFLDFQNGAVVLSSNLLLNPDFKKSLDKFNFINLNAEKDILKLIPAEDIILAGNFRINPEKISSLLEFFNLGDPSFLEDFEKETGTKPEDALNSVQGSVAFSINGVMPFVKDPNADAAKTYQKENIPVLFAAMQINNEKIFTRFLAIVKQKEPVIEKNGYYVIKAEGLPFFLMIRNNFIILTNEEKYISEIISSGEVKTNILTLDISKTLINNPICFYLNLDRESYSEKVRNYMKGEMDQKFAAGMESFGASLKSLTINGSIEKSELRVELKDKSVNSLAAILKSLDNQ
jgi:hypothetical protein